MFSCNLPRFLFHGPDACLQVHIIRLLPIFWQVLRLVDGLRRTSSPLASGTLGNLVFKKTRRHMSATAAGRRGIVAGAQTNNTSHGHQPTKMCLRSGGSEYWPIFRRPPELHPSAIAQIVRITPSLPVD